MTLFWFPATHRKAKRKERREARKGRGKEGNKMAEQNSMCPKVWRCHFFFSTGDKTRALYRAGKHPTTEQHPGSVDSISEGVFWILECTQCLSVSFESACAETAAAELACVCWMCNFHGQKGQIPGPSLKFRWKRERCWEILWGGTVCLAKALCQLSLLTS